MAHGYQGQIQDYTLVATRSKSRFQGGVAILFKKKSSGWSIEDINTPDHNIVYATLVIGTNILQSIGTYLPPDCDISKELNYIETI